MSIYQPDQRRVVDPNSTEFSIFPFPAVTAIDTQIIAPSSDEVVTIGDFEGSGIAITPNYVLTAAHVVHDETKSKIIARNVRATTSAKQKDLISRTIGTQGDPSPNVSQSQIHFLGNDFRQTKAYDDDIALLKTDEPLLLTANQVIGLTAFVNPEDAIGFTAETAGYPGDNVSQPIFGNSGADGRDLVVAPGDSTLGTVHSVINERLFFVNQNIDMYRGQSGSGVWSSYQGDPLRVFGLLNFTPKDNSSIYGENGGILITTDVYNQIANIIEADSVTADAESLPVNLIIGSNPGFFSPIINNGNDKIFGSYRREHILGNGGNDTLLGEGGSDQLEGGVGNDILDGGKGDKDVAVFSEEYTTENYDYSISEDGEIITFSNISTTGTDGTDTLQNIEWAEFKGEEVDLETLSATTLASESNLASTSTPRIIPLPLEDGVLDTETIKATDTTASPNPNDLPTPPHVSLSAPVAMLDGNVDYTLNISPYKPDTQYNISYILDTSASMDSGELQAAKNAYTDLTNYFINSGLAENINFGVVKFSRNATLYKNLTAQQAITTIQGLTSSPAIEGTEYDNALYQAFNFLSQSPLNALNTTNIAYFVSDGRSDINTNFYHDDAQRLRRFSNVQAFGIYDPLDPGGVTSSQINFVDSNNGVLVNNLNDLSSELNKSGLASKVSQVNILVDGVVVDTIQPNELTDSPLGLTYEGSIEDLDVSVNAKNVITAQVVFNDSTATTSADYTVTAGEGELVDASGNPIVESGEGDDGDPLERIRNGSEGDDKIVLGYADRGVNGGAGGDYIVGNKRDNTLDGGAGNDTILGHQGNDKIVTGTGTNKVYGGDGIDTAVYGDVVYQGNTSISLRRAADTVNYNNTDTLTDVEFIQFSEYRGGNLQKRIVPSFPVEANILRSGVNASLLVPHLCHLSV
jgi:Ca2+-binding RTX toxin-like protein